MGSLKNKRRWVLLGALGLLALLLVVVALVLPRLVDAESYRDILRSSLERQLGREVDFGAMELSLWPVPGLRLDDLVIGRGADERFEKPVVAQRLRVGARPFPLLRGRLEVTSLIVEAPVLAVIDGKRLLVARFPLMVTLTVYDRQGRSSSATREVER